jgi:hypothetical protein
MSAFDYVFNPAFHSFTVVENDINGVDFRSSAYAISGTIMHASSGDPLDGSVTLEITNGEDTWSVPQRSNYSFIVPDGNYTITPIDYSSSSCTFNHRADT